MMGFGTLGYSVTVWDKAAVQRAKNAVAVIGRVGSLFI